MSEYTRSSHEPEIVYSQAVKAGRRTYFIDVKTSSNGEMFLSVTESKKSTFGSPDAPQVSFEKHKIFLYPEDFEKFKVALNDTIDYITRTQGPREARQPRENNSDINLGEMEF